MCEIWTRNSGMESRRLTNLAKIQWFGPRKKLLFMNLATDLLKLRPSFSQFSVDNIFGAERAKRAERLSTRNSFPHKICQKKNKSAQSVTLL